MHDPLIARSIAVLLLLLVASISAIAFKRLHFPYTIGLVVVGLVLGWLSENVPALTPLEHLHLSHELILFIFLPPLVFESALNLDCQLLLRNVTPILVLAVPGLLLSTAIVGIIVGSLTPLSLAQAFLFGGLISATDPVAVIALFKELGVPKRLMVLVEGESLFNDAAAIATFQVLLSVSLSGNFSAVTLANGAVEFLFAFFGGVVVGAILGMLMGYFIDKARENIFVLSTVSGLVAYGAFIIGEHQLQVSGVIAVLVAGMVVAWQISVRLSPENRQFLHEFWEYISFLANSLIFLLVGMTTASFLQANRFQMWAGLGEGGMVVVLLVAIAAVLLARGVAVFGLLPLTNWLRRRNRVNWRYQAIAYWGGIRGAVGLALALSLAPDFPHRKLILMLTLGVAMFTLLVSGTTIKQLIYALKINRPSLLNSIEKAQAAVLSKKEAIQQIHFLQQIDPYLSPDIWQHYQQQYQQELEQAENHLANLWSQADIDSDGAGGEPSRTIRQVLWLQALAIERQGYRHLYDEGLLAELTLEKLNLASYLKQESVQGGQFPPPAPTPSLLETRWEKFWHWLTHTPQAKFSSQVPKQKRADAIRYEYNLAIAYVGKQVATKIQSLPQETGFVNAAANECVDFFQKSSEAARERLAATNQGSSQVAVQLQAKLLQRCAYLGEQESIQQLLEDGIINTKVASQLKQKLEENILHARSL
ncbi:sodium:proton antiporter [Geitlerinema sp. PCC 9228]|uniref:cation:proton antiporter n=1 Tax=Geitlerinema sp. PCC 9228 TaxID=111611 RepID=UPI0008F9C195|nr:sodium:proton antiporter [Geitlerinema sp. PCC 9228]